MQLTFAQTQPLCGDFQALVQQRIAATGFRRIADLGGGANPLLSPAFVRRHGLEYTLFDISEQELAKAPAGFYRLRCDLGSPSFHWEGQRFELALSRMVAEHVPDGRQFHRNVLQLLVPGGIAMHCFPTLYALPFLVNRALSQRSSSWLLDRVQPRDRYCHAKFPAVYSWCRGPSIKQCRRLQRLGYEVIEYRGLFGHPYFEAVPWLDRLQRRFSNALLRHPLPWLTSYAYLTVRRPERQTAIATAAEPLLS